MQRDFLLDILEEIIEIDKQSGLIVGYAVLVRKPVRLITLKDFLQRAAEEPPGIEDIKFKERDDITKFDHYEAIVQMRKIDSLDFNITPEKVALILLQVHSLLSWL